MNIFISYSHKDVKFKDRLITHLGAFRKENPIDPWHDKKIGVGNDWRIEIDNALKRANAAILPVSADIRWITPVFHGHYNQWKSTPPDRLTDDPHWHWRLKIDRVSQFSYVVAQTRLMPREKSPLRNGALYQVTKLPKIGIKRYQGSSKYQVHV